MLVELLRRSLQLPVVRQSLLTKEDANGLWRRSFFPVFASLCVTEAGDNSVVPLFNAGKKKKCAGPDFKSSDQTVTSVNVSQISMFNSELEREQR